MSGEQAASAGIRATIARPAVLVGGFGGALATVLALSAFLAGGVLVNVAGSESTWLVLLGGVLAYDLARCVLTPAVLPGLLVGARGEAAGTRFGDGVRTVVAAGRAHYRDYLGEFARARLASYGFAVLLAPLVVALALVVATAVSWLLYAGGIVRTPDPTHVTFALVWLVILIKGAGTVPVAFTGLIAGAGTGSGRAWRQSASLVGRQPRAAGGPALGRFLLDATPISLGIGILYLVPGEEAVELVAVVATILVVGTVTSTVGGVVLVRGFDGLGERSPAGRSSADRSKSIPPDRLRPSRATVLVLLLVSGLAVASAGVRVADVRPTPESGAGASIAAATEQNATALYDAALERTLASSRNVTLTSARRNHTTGERQPTLRVHTAIARDSRELWVEGWSWHDDTWTSIGRAYASDGLYLRDQAGGRPRNALATTTRGDWQAVAAPQYATTVATLPDDAVPVPDARWERRTVENGTVILGIDSPDAVRDALGLEAEPRRAYQNDSQITVRIDAGTGRIERVETSEHFGWYEHESRQAVRNRLHRETTIAYRYDTGALTRPDVGGPWLPALLWDLAYY